MSNTASLTVPRKAWIPVLTVALGTAVFDLLFWERNAGLNFLLFTYAIIIYLVQDRTWRGLSSAARMALAGAFVAGTMVYVHDSVIAIVATLVTLVLASAFAHEARLRSPFYAGLQGVTGFLMTPINAISHIGGLAPAAGVPGKGWRWVKLGLLPVLLLFLFMQLYRAGNPKFDLLTAGFMDALFQMIGDLLEAIFTPHTLFILFAAVICGALLQRMAPDTVVNMELAWKDVLLRTRIRRPAWMKPLSLDPLERERRMGLILLVAVNLLLATVNVIDINWVWSGFDVPERFSLKQFVHEGTWMLIISILLSMVILMYLFRRNQNFYRRSNVLKWLAMAWTFQNFILGISVFLRNYHYISFHGLAYKRIGVIVFLALVLVGLITLYIKIRRTKSLFYLARVNGWAAFFALVGLSTVDWDSLIVRYNLAHWNQGEIDVDNYLRMSDKVLPLLVARIDVVEAQMAKHSRNEVRWVNGLDIEVFRRAVDENRSRFLAQYERSTWQESSLADTRTARALTAHGN